MTDTPARDFPPEPTPGSDPELPTLTDVVDTLDDVRAMLDGAADALTDRHAFQPADVLDDYADVQDQVARAWSYAMLALTGLRDIAAKTTTEGTTP